MVRCSIAARLTVLVALALGSAAPPSGARPPEPIVYSIKIPAPDSHLAEIDASIPTDGKPVIEVMMAVWSPGFYRVENYATRVRELTAHAPDGRALQVESPRPNRWRIATLRAPRVTVSYRLYCNERSVTTNSIGPELVVLNGAATFITLAERVARPHEVRIELPPTAPRLASGLEQVPGGTPADLRAPDFDTLVDSPIVAGNLDTHEFDVDGRKHVLADAGERGAWNGEQAARDLERIVRASLSIWGKLPYQRYVFLNVFRPGGGGLEHKDSTLLTANAARASTPAGYRSWLSFVAHEYFHAFNVKRLRPVELGPFDYENPPRTASLWLSEGVTSYYASLFLARSGLADRDEFLASISSPIRQLQQAPGRLQQTLEQSSLEVWSNSMSGVKPSASTVSYYVKGEIVGFLLDARIRAATSGRASLDDVMRLACRRYCGERGFTPDEFQRAAGEIARTDLRAWFKTALASTDELDYGPALDWLGLRFALPDPPNGPATWKLEVSPDATAAQQEHLASLLAPTTTK